MNNPLFSSLNLTSLTFKTHIVTKSPIFIIERQEESLPIPEIPVCHFVLPKRKKDSSLKHICLKILSHYYDKVDMEVHLNDFSVKMGVERRRIYDIVNILEGFDIFVKKAKNLYIWRGLNVFLLKLKVIESLDNNSYTDLKLFKFEKTPLTSKKKSLTYLSLRFLKSLCNQSEGLGFKTVLKRFADELNDGKLLTHTKADDKNVVRRLYDIVNVFKALGLISKQLAQSGKQDFCWQGSQGMAKQINSLTNDKNEADIVEGTLMVFETAENNIFAETSKKENVSIDKYELKTSGFSVVKGFQGFDAGKLRMAVLRESNKGNLF